MKRTNFSACLWTVIGVQRQSLASQPHVAPGTKLLTIEDFDTIDGQPALPHDLLDPNLINSFKKLCLHPVDKIESVWTTRFRARTVTRVPLKLDPVDDPRVCARCNSFRCSCFMQDILATQVAHSEEDEIEDVGDEDSKKKTRGIVHSVHMTDNVTGSADGLLNFFPSAMKPFNIGSKVGLSRILSEFYIENRDDYKVKIVNTDVQIYERIIKVRVFRLCHLSLHRFTTFNLHR